MSALMRALRFAELGPPSVLRIEAVAVPEPGEGEALIHAKTRRRGADGTLPGL
jgi:hypothetical protein